ncbi:hypothetical protein BJY01DRAFT_248334 [Aspergillus pseudoustus]|uniref:Fungal-specific transcription factor domain-containing protein n=1 Tax=Aspergillus pseudoustus TaxID=1810923 RepID=A0ABR4JVK0_9EURO
MPFRVRESPQERSFLFIDSQDDVSQERGVGRQKMAFLSKVAHQRRKRESVERLKHTRSTKTPENTPGDEEEERSMHAVTTQGRVALTGYMGQGYVDPFNARPVRMTDSMNMYFHHFVVQVSPTTIPLDGAQEGMIWAQRSNGLLANFYTGLFLAAGNKAMLERKHGVDKLAISRTSQDAIRLRVEAIKCLNQLVQTPVTAATESTILCVSIMNHCEALNAQAMASQTHMAGLNTLIDLVGGLEVLKRTTISTIYQGDIANAALHDSKPRFTMLPRFLCEVHGATEMFLYDINTSKFEYGHWLHPSLIPLGTRFTQAPWYAELDPAMKTTISASRRLIVHFEMATMLPRLVRPTDKDLSIILLHHLLSLSCPDDYLDEPLRRTLFIYTYLRVWHFGNFPVMGYIVDSLRQCLIPRILRLHTAAPDLLLWILFMGAMASQQHDCHPWFVSHLRGAAAHLELKEWGEARAVLAEFFYTDQRGYTTGEEIWNEVLTPDYTCIAPRVSEIRD